MDKMKESTGAICIRENFPETELSFAEILLDERLLNSDIWISKKALSAVGGINYRLNAKRNYELLIRISQKYRVYLLGKKDGAHFLHKENAADSWIRLSASDRKSVV